MRFIIDSGLRLRFMVVAAAVVLVVAAGLNLRRMPVNLLPEFSPPMVEVQTEALGLSAAEVEQLITVPLEADLLNGVAWLETIRSQSIPSLSSIELLFAPGTDFMAARHMVQEKMTQAAGLPNVSKPPVMLQPLSSTSRMLQIGLRSKVLSDIQLSVLAQWDIRPRLMGVPGVANVSIWGQRNRQLQVLIDPERLRAAGIPLRDIIATTGNALWVSPLSFLDASTPGTGGFIDGPNQRLGVRHVLPIVSPDGLADVVIENSSKRLGDVTTVVESHQPLIGDAVITGGPGLMLVVQKFPWANTLDVTRNVERALDQMRPGLAGIDIDSRIFRPAGFIERSVANLEFVLLASGALALGGLLLAFFNLRMTLIAVAAIATALLLAWFVAFVLDVVINAFLFAGLAMAVAIVIDDAVVDTQQLRASMARPRPDGVSRSAALAAASQAVRVPLGFATLMALLPILPLFYMDGVLGTFMAYVAPSYAVATLASFAVALILTPALGMLLLPDAQGEAAEAPPEPGGAAPARTRTAFAAAFTARRSARFSAPFKAYGAQLARRLPQAKWPACGVAVAALLAAFALLPVAQHRELLPEFHETDLLVRWEARAGTSRPEMNRITTRVVQELRGISGVRNVGGHLGRAINSDQIVGVSSGELWISIDPHANYHAALGAIHSVLAGYPGMQHDISTYAADRIEKMRGVDNDQVVVRLYGQDPEVLSVEARKLKTLVSDIPGVSEIKAPAPVIEPTVEIRVDLARAQKYGIKPGDVRRAAATLLSGLQVGSLFEQKKIFDVIVWSVPQARASLTDIRNLLLQSPDGTYVRLHDVADVRIRPHPAVIKRESVARYVDVEIDVGKRRPRDVADEASQLLGAHHFPSEYHARVLGGDDRGQGNRRRLWVAISVVPIGVLLLLQAVFRSWRLALAVLSTVPVAPFGGILAMFVTGAHLSVGALLGLVVVAGLALRMATLQVLAYRRLEHAHRMPPDVELMVRGARVRPILTSCGVIALAMLPLFLLRDSAGLEVIGPMASMILAGLCTTLVFTFFILPAAYLAVGGSRLEEDEFENLLEGTQHE